MYYKEIMADNFLNLAKDINTNRLKKLKKTQTEIQRNPHQDPSQ
jgi:hypothetical protein